MDPRRIRELDLFADLSSKEVDEVSRLVDEVDVPGETPLVGEGDFAYEFFLIEEGTASVEVDGEHVTDLGPGQWFGEIALLESPRRTATVRATTPMKLAVIFGPNFRDLTRRFPRIGETIRAEIEERLARAS
jgi:CRP/FNR family cyclic AMP-dependent transcriptional regulator